MAALRRASPILLVVGIWLAFHPYAGIVHDSRLYVAQALRALHPEIFDKDFFFAFGSQDDFSLFSKVFAPMVDLLGPTPATMVAVALSHALWLAGAAALALRLAPDRPSAIAGLAIVAGMPAFYGGWLVFSLGEGFFTSRLPAEGMALWALWALVGRKWGLASALAVTCALFHPLVGLTAFAVGFVFLVLLDVRWIALGLAGMVVISVLAFADVAPFDALARTMDPEWLAVVQQRNIFVFPGRWPAASFAYLAFFIMTAGAVAALLDGWRRRLVISAIVAALGGLLIAYVGGDLMHNTFVIQVQAWRAIWLLAVVAYLGAGLLMVRLWQLKPDGLALIALIAFAWLLSEFVNNRLGVALGTFACTVAVLRLRNLARPIPAILCKASIGLLYFLVVMLAAYRGKIVVDLLEIVPGQITFWDAFVRLTEIEGAAAAVMVLTLARCWPEISRKILPVMALLLVVASAAIWDRRTEVAIALTAEEPPAAFDRALAPDAQVFWERDVRGTWFLLRRPSYFSSLQGSGVLFHRETAMTFLHHARVLEPLMGEDMTEWSHRTDPKAPEYFPLPALDRGMLARACRQDSSLDAMVLSRGVDGAYVAEWSLPRPHYRPWLLHEGYDVPPLQHFYLYRCADLR